MPDGIFLQLEVDFDQDEDVAKLARYTKPGEARACRDLLVSMWRYCKRRKTDGHVPAEMIGQLAYPDSLKIAQRDAAHLVECGLAQITETGYYLPGFLKHNKSKAQIEAASEHLAATGSEAGKWGNHLRHHVKKNKPNGKCDYCQNVGSVSGQPEPDGSGSLAHRTEDIGHRTESETKEGGDRHLTSVDGRVPIPTHCLDHRYVENPGACGGCKEARLAHEARSKREREESTAEAQAACTYCDPDGWVLDEHGDATTRKCQRHRKRTA